MANLLLSIIHRGILTQRDCCPDLSTDAAGMPAVSAAPCRGTGCRRCATACPTQAITITDDAQGGVIILDRGRCIGCQACLASCASGTLVTDRSTRLAVRTRAELLLTNRRLLAASPPPPHLPFLRSLHVREVATGDNASDLEVIAGTNAIFDVARFGIHFVASPRFADLLLVTGPVGRAMREPLRRCYDAMAAPRLVLAAGTAAISGGLHAGGYAEANGVDAVLPVDGYIPGDPPHPWSIIHGLLLAMGRM